MDKEYLVCANVRLDFIYSQIVILLLKNLDVYELIEYTKSMVGWEYLG